LVKVQRCYYSKIRLNLNLKNKLEQDFPRVSILCTYASNSNICISRANGRTDDEYCSSNCSEMDRDRSMCYRRPRSSEEKSCGRIGYRSGPDVLAQGGCARKTGSIVSEVPNFRLLDVVKRTSKQHTHTHIPHKRHSTRTQNTHTHTHTHTSARYLTLHRKARK